MSDRETFGPRLRSERERRGISLETIASVTKVGAELWDGLERNDFSRWPTGIFARAFVRDYARAVGLDADEVVDEFCRLFAVGDRRAERLIKAHGALIGHNVAFDGSGVPPTGDRRASAASARSRRGPAASASPREASPPASTRPPRCRWRPVSRCCSIPASGRPPASSGSRTTALSTVALGSTPGTRAVDALRQWMPALFTVQDRRAHA